MRTGIDTSSTSKWLAARRQVQQTAEVVLGDAAAFFLYRGKLRGEGRPGQYISALLGSTEGCELVLQFLQRLDAGESLEAIVVDDKGREPDGPGRPVLTLIVGHLSRVLPDGRSETVGCVSRLFACADAACRLRKRNSRVNL